MKENEVQAVEQAIRILMTVVERKRVEDEDVEERRKGFKVIEFKRGNHREKRKK